MKAGLIVNIFKDGIIFMYAHFDDRMLGTETYDMNLFFFYISIYWNKNLKSSDSSGLVKIFGAY